MVALSCYQDVNGDGTVDTALLGPEIVFSQLDKPSATFTLGGYSSIWTQRGGGNAICRADSCFIVRRISVPPNPRQRGSLQALPIVFGRGRKARHRLVGGRKRSSAVATLSLPTKRPVPELSALHGATSKRETSPGQAQWADRPRGRWIFSTLDEL
jgi:hypothetical protein